MAEPLRQAFENKPLEKTKKDPKRMSVERIYQKKTQLEHILLRPDSYIGSVEPVTQQMWVYDEDVGLNCRDVTFVPGLYKIFDEILVNAADNKQRDKSMSCIKINIDIENNTISVWNNGKGIPVVEHKVEKVFVPALIFGQLLTSSNYDDDEKKVTGGRNGYGAKLCNIFSTKFTVETACKESKKGFKQTWYDNMGRTGDSQLKPFDGEEFTCITFRPDLPKFKMSILDKDTVALMTRRAYDIAGSSKGVRVFFNGKRLPVTSFRSYIDMYLKDKVDELGGPLNVIHEAVNDRWEVCLAMSEKGFQQVSFVNSIATTKGGRHVDYVADQVVGKLIEVVKKKNKAGVVVKPFQVKNHMWLFVNCLIENPTFDSQTKENMTLQHKNFGSSCTLSDKFFKQALSSGIVESIMNWVKFKAQSQLNKKCSAVKHTKIKGVPKLDDANDAGGKNSINCTLILTEGDSAKTLAVSGLGIVGRDRYGVFPLRGKMLNVREATHKQIMENAEINNIIKILGLQYKKNYSDPDSLKTLRYGKLMIMTDQDLDGSHIKGLLINFIHHNWPSLLRHNFLEEFITPIIKVSQKKTQMSFYSIPEFNEWKDGQSSTKSWKIKYYKGLGTSTSQEAKEYFSDMQRHRIPFKYSGPEDDEAITLAFSKKKVDERKEWLTNFMINRRQRRELNLPEEYLYGQTTKSLSYNDFVNKELVLFSNSDNERSLPCSVDGLKPGQRKVLFCCFKRNDKREVKVAQLAGSVAEMSAYHHGEVSLMMTIVGLAQNFVGSNNLNLLQPLGQFGTRLHGGKDSASPRYIFTMLSSLARLVFPPVDDNLLKYNYDDNQRVEPEWYLPIIPTVLVNGSEGIGTGWATKIPNYDIREIINNISRMLEGQEPQPMLPSYKGFRGTIEQVMNNQFMNSGEISIIDSTTIEISELPVKTWTQTYKENVLEPMLNGSEKVQPLITDYKEYHTDTTVRFVVKMAEDKLKQAEAAGLHKVFKLQSPLTCNSMVLFDHVGSLKKYESVQEILKDFFDLRMKYYVLRKDWLVGMLGAENAKLTNQARFILEKIEGTLVIENKPKKELIRMLQQMGYDSDPVKAWKEAQEKNEEQMEEGEDEEGKEEEDTSGPDYNYLLSMPMWYLTKEKKDELCKQRDHKMAELNSLKKKNPADLWKEDLAAFSEELERIEAKEKESAKMPAVKGKAKSVKVKQETLPTPQGRRVIPRVTSTMKADAAKKGRKPKSENVVMKMEFGEDSENAVPSEELGLAARLSKKTITQAKEKASKTGKQTTLTFKAVAKKLKKDSDAEVDDLSGSDMEAEEVAAPRERIGRKTKAAAQKYTLSSDDEFEDWGKCKPGRKLAPSNDDDDDDASFAPDPSAMADDSDMASPAPPPRKAPEPAKKVTKSKSTVKQVESKSSSQSDEQAPATKAPVKRKTKEAAPKKPAAAKKAAAPRKKAADVKQPSILDALSKPKPPSKSAAKSLPSLDSSDSEGEVKPPVAKAKPVLKRKTVVSDDSDSSSDDLMSRLKAKNTNKKSKKWDDDSFQLSEAESPKAVAPRDKPSRARKPVTYNLDSDSD
ncbi:DNA topoisomerase 2-alpha isoform X2 [Solea senegalensis]|uniref:DNA topoisomerase 2 n=1 Tax=Solea senegalensis TaxID=28829 RepID=A0AAV6RQR7_SOLSE|nr:DNA topoisomerase 2-alpha [Solea senegalensis]KAG7506667.1 DNA topoisomerase 2-alpha isoform X2 [Solea senegalensis]